MPTPTPLSDLIGFWEAKQGKRSGICGSRVGSVSYVMKWFTWMIHYVHKRENIYLQENLGRNILIPIIWHFCLQDWKHPSELASVLKARLDWSSFSFLLFPHITSMTLRWRRQKSQGQNFPFWMIWVNCFVQRRVWTRAWGNLCCFDRSSVYLLISIEDRRVTTEPSEIEPSHRADHDPSVQTHWAFSH